MFRVIIKNTISNGQHTLGEFDSLYKAEDYLERYLSHVSLSKFNATDIIEVEEEKEDLGVDKPAQ
jgi:hypothetical protein